MEVRDARSESLSSVLQHLLTVRSTTRLELSAATGLSKATVARVVEDLVEQGLVSETAGPSSGGRPPRVVRFLAEKQLVCGMDLDTVQVRAVLSDGGGRLLAKSSTPTRHDLDPEGLARWLVERVHALNPVRDPAVICVGLPGVVDLEAHRVHQSPTMPQLGDGRFLARLTAEVEAASSRLVVDNDCNLALLGELYAGEAREASTAVMMRIQSGVGAGVAVNGRLFRGRHGLAGEVGSMLAELDGTTLEDVLSGPGLLKQAIGAGLPIEAAETLFTGGQGRALLQVRERAFQALVAALIAFTTSYDPDVVVVGGTIGSLLGPFLPEIARRLDAQISPSPRLVASSIGDVAGAVGAIGLALETTYRSLGVDLTGLENPRLRDALSTLVQQLSETP